MAPLRKTAFAEIVRLELGAIVSGDGLKLSAGAAQILSYPPQVSLLWWYLGC